MNVPVFYDGKRAMKKLKVYEFRNPENHSIQVQDISIKHAYSSARLQLNQALTGYFWISNNNPGRDKEPESLTVIKWSGEVLKDQTWRKPDEWVRG